MLLTSDWSFDWLFLFRKNHYLLGGGEALLNNTWRHSSYAPSTWDTEAEAVHLRTARIPWWVPGQPGLQHGTYLTKQKQVLLRWLSRQRFLQDKPNEFDPWDPRKKPDTQVCVCTPALSGRPWRESNLEAHKLGSRATNWGLFKYRKLWGTFIMQTITCPP